MYLAAATTVTAKSGRYAQLWGWAGSPMAHERLLARIDAGHDVHENRPDAFVSAVLGWLDERRGAALP
jgi:hypothetical protein